jgi:hypothetical protein
MSTGHADTGHADTRTPATLHRPRCIVIPRQAQRRRGITIEVERGAVRSRQGVDYASRR